MSRIIFNIFNYSNLTKTEKYIMKRINKEPYIIVSKPISKIAIEWCVSLPSLTRFSKKVGFRNFADLRLFVVQRLEQLKKYRVKKKSDSIENLMKVIEIEYQLSFKETFTEEKNIEVIKYLAKKIVNSDNVLIYGFDLNKLPATIMFERFSEFGINTRYSSESYLFTSYLNIFNKNAICIIFSKSLNDDRYKKIINLSNKKNIEIFFITASLKYKEHKRVLIKFDASRASTSLLIVNLQTAIINLLLSSILQKNKDLVILEEENEKI